MVSLATIRRWQTGDRQGQTMENPAGFWCFSRWKPDMSRAKIVVEVGLQKAGYSTRTLDKKLTAKNLGLQHFASVCLSAGEKAVHQFRDTL